MNGIEEMIRAIRPRAVLVFDYGCGRMYASVGEDPAMRELVRRLNPGGITVTFLADGPKVSGVLPWTLPGTEEQISVRPGDILLSGGNRISVSLEAFTGNFIRLSQFQDLTPEKAKKLFSGDEVKLYLEWSE